MRGSCGWEGTLSSWEVIMNICRLGKRGLFTNRKTLSQSFLLEQKGLKQSNQASGTAWQDNNNLDGYGRVQPPVQPPAANGDHSRWDPISALYEAAQSLSSWVLSVSKDGEPSATLDPFTGLTTDCTTRTTGVVVSRNEVGRGENPKYQYSSASVQLTWHAPHAHCAAGKQLCTFHPFGKASVCPPSPPQYLQAQHRLQRDCY